MKELMLYGGLGFLFIILSIIRIKQEPRHISNGFLLELGIFYLLFFLVYFSFILNNGFGIILGFTIIFLVIICLVITGILLSIDGFYVIRKEGFSIVHIQPIFWGLLTFLGAYTWYFNAFGGISGSHIQVVILTFIMNLVFNLFFRNFLQRQKNYGYFLISIVRSLSKIIYFTYFLI